MSWDDYDDPYEAAANASSDPYGDPYGEDFDDEDSLTQPCPNCEAEVYEDAPACPVCGELIDWAATHRTSATRPPWVAVVAVLLIAAMLLGVVL